MRSLTANGKEKSPAKQQAISEKEGFTDFRFSEIGIIQLLAKNAKKAIPVMDSSKLGKCSKRKVLSLDQADILLMDNHVPEEAKDKYRKKDLKFYKSNKTAVRRLFCRTAVLLLNHTGP